MQHTTIWINICFFYALLPHALCIACYRCTSFDHGVKECDDTFATDVTTEGFIAKNCVYGYWDAHFCIKLKGTREDGSTIMVRECSTDDWGSHCGLIQFERDNRLEDIEGCLETCNYDGCNLATTNYLNNLVLWLHLVVTMFLGCVR